MRKIKLVVLAVGVGAAIGVPQVVLGADTSQAMAQHMRLMDSGNPGMQRMMETGMGHMDEAPAFQMPPVHP